MIYSYLFVSQLKDKNEYNGCEQAPHSLKKQTFYLLAN